MTNSKKLEHSAALLKHVWSLKEKKERYSIKWSVNKKAAAYQTTTNRCNLCPAEKIPIIKADKNKSLRKQTELVSKSRQENAFYLHNFLPG